jgi:hypothetical protein
MGEEMFGQISEVVYGVRWNAGKPFAGCACECERKRPASDFIWYSAKSHMGPKLLEVGHVVDGPIIERYGLNFELGGRRKIQHPRCERQIRILKRIFYCY